MITVIDDLIMALALEKVSNQFELDPIPHHHCFLGPNQIGLTSRDNN